MRNKYLILLYLQHDQISLQKKIRAIFYYDSKPISTMRQHKTLGASMFLERLCELSGIMLINVFSLNR